MSWVRHGGGWLCDAHTMPTVFRGGLLLKSLHTARVEAAPPQGREPTAPGTVILLGSPECKHFLSAHALSPFCRPVRPQLDDRAAMAFAKVACTGMIRHRQASALAKVKRLGLSAPPQPAPKTPEGDRAAATIVAVTCHLDQRLCAPPIALPVDSTAAAGSCWLIKRRPCVQIHLACAARSALPAARRRRSVRPARASYLWRPDPVHATGLRRHGRLGGCRQW